MTTRRAFLRFLGLGAAGAVVAPALPAAAPSILDDAIIARHVDLVGSLSAISAGLGEVTAGRLVMGDGSYIDLDRGTMVLQEPASPAARYKAMALHASRQTVRRARRAWYRPRYYGL